MFEQVLNSEGSRLISEVQSNIQAADKNVSGKTAQSIKKNVSETETSARLLIDAAKWFFTLEEGRGPGKRPPVEPIKEWLRGRGYQGNLGIAFHIAKNIGKFGTKLYQQGGRKDIFSNVINENAVKSIQDKIADITLKATADGIIERYEKGN